MHLQSAAAPEAGTVDLNEVNVSYAINGGMQDPLYKRATPTEDCSMTGCWDYTTTNQVELFGKACTSDVMGAMDADVEITVGCMTIVQPDKVNLARVEAGDGRPVFLAQAERSVEIDAERVAR